MNKRGIHCALLRAVFSLTLFFPYLHPTLSISLPCTPVGLELVIFRIPLAYQSLFYTTTLRGSIDNSPSKAHVYFT